MFIDFTTERIELDPERSPTSLVIRTNYRSPEDNVECSSRGVRISPSWFEQTTVGERTFEIRDYMLTIYEEDTLLAEMGQADFIVFSHFLDEDNQWQRRDVTVDIILRPDQGWVVEIGQIDRAEGVGVVVFSIRMPNFDPQAQILLDVSLLDKLLEPKEEKPPGRPIWERLEDES